MILVTGGTGLVGSHLLFELVSSNKKVRATYRRAEKLEKVKHVFSYYSENWEALYDSIEWVEADITDIPKLQIAFKSVTHVYHCAAFISFEPDKYLILRKINIKGTANIVNLSISHKVEKLCYVSSIATIGHHTDTKKLINETTAWNPEDDNSVYGITKYGAELEVWRGTQEGLNAIIVNPGVILGPGFWRSGGSGSLFRRIYNGLSYYTDGGSGYIDVYDAINIMIQLMESDITNENYILTSENLSFNQFNDMVSDAMGIQKKRREIKAWQLQFVWRIDWLNHKLFGKRRKLSKQLAKTLITVSNYDNSKVKNELSYNFKPIKESIKVTSDFFISDLKK